MGSNVLPQALITIARTPAQCHPRKLGFSVVASAVHSSSIDSTRLSLSRVSLCSRNSRFNCLVSKRDNRSFVVRVEANSEGEVGNGEEGASPEAAEGETETDSGLEAQSEAEAKEKQPRKPRIKLGDIMGILNQRAIEASDEQRPTPDLRTGDIVEIKRKAPNKRRLVTHKGIIISKQNAGIHTTIRIRRMVAGIGVEIVLPVYSPNIKEIKVVRHRKVRRARLYYLRDKLPRFSTFK